MPFFWREKDARQNHVFLNESEKLYEKNSFKNKTESTNHPHAQRGYCSY